MIYIIAVMSTADFRRIASGALRAARKLRSEENAAVTKNRSDGGRFPSDTFGAIA